MKTLHVIVDVYWYQDPASSSWHWRQAQCLRHHHDIYTPSQTASHQFNPSLSDIAGVWSCVPRLVRVPRSVGVLFI